MLLPATLGVTLSHSEPSGTEPVTPQRLDPKMMAARTGVVRHGTRSGRPDVRLLGGYFVCDSPDAAMLVSLLPALVHVRGAPRLSTLVSLVADESSEERPGRDLMLERLVEVMLVEALRATPSDRASAWRMALAKDLLRRGDLGVGEVAERVDYGSQSTFSTAFSRHVGQPPRRYAREQHA